MATTGQQLDTRGPHRAGQGHVPGGRPAPGARFPLRDRPALAERLGYAAADLDRIPAAAIDSFAGVGYFLDLAAIEPSDVVLDLGSGSGMDSFLAALAASGRAGHRHRHDRRAAGEGNAPGRRTPGLRNVEFRKGLIESLEVEPGSVDCVISNGVINLSPDKPAVFASAAKALAARRPLGDRRHRLGHPAARRRDLRCLALGRLHRRRHAAATSYAEAIDAAGFEIDRGPGAMTSTGSSQSAPTTRRRNTA